MTRRSVAQLEQAALEAVEDPSREHVADALDAGNLIVWGDMVRSGWWPDAGEEEGAMQLLLAWTHVNYGVEHD